MLSIEERILVGRDHFNGLSEMEKNQYLDEAMDYWRNIHGFPYFPSDPDFRNAEFSRLSNFPLERVLIDGRLMQATVGLSLAWSYFPHAMKVPCMDLMSPYDAFMDDKKMRRALGKVFVVFKAMNASNLRRTFFMLAGVQGVSNFRPTAAGAMYNRFCSGGTVWDCSCGWGGRLFGFIVSNAKTYIGTDPSTVTQSGLQEIVRDYGQNKDIRLHTCGSEEFMPEEESLDFCFTSPPYFDTEKYSDEETQSFKKFSTPHAWIKGFMMETLNNCRVGLKSGKYCMINIADTKKVPDLVERTIRAGQTVGLEYKGTWSLTLSNINLKNKHRMQFKEEPIIIFRKK